MCSFFLGIIVKKFFNIIINLAKNINAKSKRTSAASAAFEAHVPFLKSNEEIAARATKSRFFIV